MLLPSEFRLRLRGYFFEAKEMSRHRNYSVLLSSMSPMLQAQMAELSNAYWLSKVDILRGHQVSRQFVARVAMYLRTAGFAVHEEIYIPATLVIMVKGVEAWDAASGLPKSRTGSFKRLRTVIR